MKQAFNILKNYDNKIRASAEGEKVIILPSSVDSILNNTLLAFQDYLLPQNSVAKPLELGEGNSPVKKSKFTSENLGMFMLLKSRIRVPES